MQRVWCKRFTGVCKMFEGLNWGAFLFALLIVELTPGPNMGWLATVSARGGFRVGLAAILGVTLGLTIQMLAAVAGLSAVLARSDFLYESLRWAGVAFMLYLAWESWIISAEPSPVRTEGGGGFTRGLIANLLNPKALVFYIAVIGQFANPERGSMWSQTFLLGCLHLTVATAIHLIIVMLGARLGARLEKWQNSVFVRSLFAAMLAGFAVWIAISTAR